MIAASPGSMTRRPCRSPQTCGRSADVQTHLQAGPTEFPVEIVTASVPDAASTPQPQWLTLGERERWNDLGDRRRQMTWATGRRLIKVAAARYLAQRKMGPSAKPVELEEIQVDSLDGLQRRVAPRVTWRGRWLPCHVALTHSEHSVAVALSLDPAFQVGIDLVPQVLDTASLDWTFSPQEKEWMESSPDRGTRRAWLWGMKEALFKSAGNHLTFQPRQIELELNGDRCGAARIGGHRVPIAWQEVLPLGDERLIVVGTAAGRTNESAA